MLLFLSVGLCFCLLGVVIPERRFCAVDAEGGCVVVLRDFFDGEEGGLDRGGPDRRRAYSLYLRAEALRLASLAPSPEHRCLSNQVTHIW